MRTPIVIDTLGQLHRYRHALFGWCRRCASRYRMAARSGENPPALFDIDVAVLIAQRGADAPVRSDAARGLPDLWLARHGGARHRAWTAMTINHIARLRARGA